MLIGYSHDLILLAGCSIDDRDSRNIMANEYENVDQLLSRLDSFRISEGCSIHDRDGGGIMAMQ